MSDENALLRMLFTYKYWYPEKEDLVEGFVPYDFKANYQKVLELGMAYLLSRTVLRRKSLQIEEMEDFRSAVMWLNSLFSFFKLGMSKQEEGKVVGIFISH